MNVTLLKKYKRDMYHLLQTT